MKSVYSYLIVIAVLAALLTGCSAPKKVPYIVDADKIPA